MKFFIDSADLNAIAKFNDYGLVDGVTTNPSLIAKSGRDFKEVVAEICKMIDGPVSAEVIATDYDNMMREAELLCNIADNVTIKLPLTMEGLKACKSLSKQNIMVNVTLCFSPLQALLAAKSGASFISPFVGRLDDLAQDGMQLIEQIRVIYDNYDYQTEILVASIRHPLHLLQAAELGADVATIPPAVIEKISHHPLTDKGLESFLSDWKKSEQSI